MGDFVVPVIEGTTYALATPDPLTAPVDAALWLNEESTA
jgi:hypothetical protein